ncbi:MAG TPA: ABC transporter [Erysipelotrichaceae bacterium]|nr:ABC transporter [Erysipelotrichaceae bacterium]
MTNAVEVHELKKAYAHFDLYVPEFTIPFGSVMGLIGENGAGKTTLIRLLCGVIGADSGEITVLGTDQIRARNLMNDVGVVTDEEALVPYMTAKETGTMMSGIYRHWDAEKYRQLIQMLDVPQETRFGELSRGNRMKTALACTLSHHAKLLMLDEATGGLDPVVRDHVLNLITEFAAQEGHAVLMSSHIVSDLEKACTDITFLHQGRVILSEKRDVLAQKHGSIEKLFLEMAER